MEGLQVCGTGYGFAKDSRGMSLVEILIAVAILSLFIGMAGYGLSLSSGKPAEECAQKIASAMQRARTATMGKNATKITIYRDSATNKIVIKQGVTTVDESGNPKDVSPDPDVIANSKDVNIEFRLNGMDDSTLSSELTIEFKRSNGAVWKINNEDITVAGAPSYMPTIKVSKGNTTRLIEIFPLTGKISLGAMP